MGNMTIGPLWKKIERQTAHRAVVEAALAEARERDRIEAAKEAAERARVAKIVADILSVKAPGSLDNLPMSEIDPPVLDAAEIISQVAAKHGLHPRELRMHRRCADLVNARHELWYRLTTETLLSLPQIGRMTGGFDHTSVMYGSNKHADEHGLPRYRRGGWKVKAAA